MGSDALSGSGVTHFLLYLIKDPEFVPSSEPLRRVRTSRVCAWVALELLGFAATFAITNTKAAIGFPVVVSPDFESVRFESRSCFLAVVGFKRSRSPETIADRFSLFQISLMIPLRTWIVPKFKTFTEEELSVLDGEVASPFTMQSL